MNIKAFAVSLIKRAAYKMSPRLVSSLQFYHHFGRRLNWTNPIDLNEKINWLKYYGDTTLWVICADKFRVREYVVQKGLSDILIPIYGKWDCVKDIDWDALPPSFVLKTNNGSGDVLVCRDKSGLDVRLIENKYNSLLASSYSCTNSEPHYSKMSPCIIAEKLMDCSTQPIHTDSLIDYKIWCFSGKVHHVWACFNRSESSVEVAVYDLQWRRHDECSIFTNHYRKASVDLPRPKCLDEMLSIAEKLSEGIPEVRVDLYEIDGHPYFGEMTFSSAGGLMTFYTPEFLAQMGELVELPK